MESMYDDNLFNLGCRSDLQLVSSDGRPIHPHRPVRLRPVALELH